MRGVVGFFRSRKPLGVFLAAKLEYAKTTPECFSQGDHPGASTPAMEAAACFCLQHFLLRQGYRELTKRCLI